MAYYSNCTTRRMASLRLGRKLHLAGAGHSEYTGKVLAKTIDIIKNSTEANLEQNMLNFAVQLRKHIEDAYISNQSMDKYFKNLTL